MPEQVGEKRSVIGRLSRVAIGSVFAVGDVVGDGVFAVAGVAKGTVNKAEEIVEPIRIPLRALGVTGLVMKPVNALSSRAELIAVVLDKKGQAGLVNTSGLVIESVGTVIDAAVVYLQDHPEIDALIQAQIDRLLPELADSPAITELIRKQVDRILPLLASNPEIQTLVQVQAQAYIDYLTDHPEALEELIRTQGDDYVDYLNHYPAAVQSLIQGQSLGMASEIRDEVRERTVTADTAIELIVRNLLRKTPQHELPPPPEDVRRRAEYGRLPSDYVREHYHGDR